MGLARLLVALAFLQAESTAYLAVNRYGSLRRSIPLLTPADRCVPLRPRSLWLYLSFLPFCLAVVYDVRSTLRMGRMMACLVIASLVSYRSFLRFPSTYPRPRVEVEDGRLARAWRSLHAMDQPGNTFPSIHVGHAFLLALMLANELPEEEAEARLLWAVLISLSTLTTKQHYFVDIAGGLLVAEAVAERVFEPWEAGRLSWRQARRGMGELCDRLDELARDPASFRLRAADRHPRLRPVLQDLASSGSLLASVARSRACSDLLERRRVLAGGLRQARIPLAALAVASPGWLQFVRHFQEAEPTLTDASVQAYLGELDPDLSGALRALVDFSGDESPGHVPGQRSDEVHEPGHPQPARIPLGGLP